MDLTSLAVFRAVAEELSVTKAAQQLARAPSNVTTRLQQLEEELGVLLFDRERKPFVLTPAGQQYLEYATRILNLSDEARAVVNPGTPTGILRVGSMECAVASRLPPFLAKFFKSWPGVSLDLTTGPTRQLTQAVKNHVIDCAFIAVPDDDWWMDAEGLEKERFVSEELQLILPPDHPAIESPRDVQPRRLAAFSPGCAYRALAEDWLTGFGTTDRNFRVNDVRSYHAIIAAVSSGACVGAVPKSVLDLNRAVAPVVDIPLAKVDTYLVWRNGPQTAALKAFKDTVLNAA